MNTGDVIQINIPDFNPDIDGGLPTKEHEETQGSDSFKQHPSRESDKHKAPCFTTMSCRRSGLVGCSTSQDPATTRPGQ